MAGVESFEEKLEGLKKRIAEEATVTEKTKLQKREEFLRLFAALKRRQEVLNQSSENAVVDSMLKGVCSVFFEGKAKVDVYPYLDPDLSTSSLHEGVSDLNLERIRRGFVVPVIRHTLEWGRVGEIGGTKGNALTVNVRENKQIEVVISHPEEVPPNIAMRFDFHQPDSEHCLQKTIMYILSNPNTGRWSMPDNTIY